MLLRSLSCEAFVTQEKWESTLKQPSSSPILIQSGIWLRELVAFIERESYDVDLLNTILSGASLVVNTRPVVDHSSITVQCLDGSILVNRATLIRHFQTFDDFLSSSSSTTVPIPFYTNTFLGVLMMDVSSSRLLRVADCLDYLQPKNILLFLDYDPEGCTSSVIYRFHSRLSEDDKRMVVALRGADSMSLSSAFSSLIAINDSPYTYLLDEVRYAPTLVVSGLLEDYPSLCVCLALCLGLPLLWPSFVRRDYSGSSCYSSAIAELIGNYLLSTKCNSLKPLVKMMAMCGIRHQALGNEEERACLPYGVVLSATGKTLVIEEHRKALESLLGRPLPPLNELL